MAPRAFQITINILIIAFVALPLLAVWLEAEKGFRFGYAEWAAIKFTLLQAFLSAFLSVAFAIPLARALARTSFPGRQLIVLFLGAPFILPVIVAVLGLILVFGQNGLLNLFLNFLGFENISIYGLQGVLLAHVYFNLPLATRMLLVGWTSVPQERFRLVQSLDLSRFDRFWLIELPVMQRYLPSAFAVIFVICLSSFAVALTLGGGPRATTIELAIYQAFRFDFDLSKASLLGLIQLFLSLSSAVLVLFFFTNDKMGMGFDRPKDQIRPTIPEKITDFFFICLAVIFLALPLLMLLFKGFTELSNLPAPVWRAAILSLSISFIATLLCLILAFGMLTKIGEIIGILGIAVSPLVLGTGLFLILQYFTNPLDYTLYVIVLVNAIMSLPFVLRILRPEVDLIKKNYEKLATALGLTPWQWFFWVVLPRLNKPLGFAAGLAAALSMGDLGVIALFGNAEYSTLPYKMYQLMGSYRMDEAFGCALLLIVLSFGLFWVFDRFGKLYA